MDAKPVHIPIAIAEPVVASANTVPSSTTYKLAITSNPGQPTNYKIVPVNYSRPLVIPAGTVSQIFGNAKKGPVSFH
jgi:hypothetical protein